MLSGMNLGSGFNFGSSSSSAGSSSPIGWLGEAWNNLTGNTDKMKYDHDEAQIARDWEEYVAKNQYSWNVEGMRSAGLNPYLAYSHLGDSPGLGPQAHSSSSNSGNILTGIANIVHATGSMAATMNSRHELKDKAKAYDTVNHLLHTALTLTNLQNRRR